MYLTLYDVEQFKVLILVLNGLFLNIEIFWDKLRKYRSFNPYFKWIGFLIISKLPNEYQQTMKF